jgi:hypothetical protein
VKRRLFTSQMFEDLKADSKVSYVSDILGELESIIYLRPFILEECS